MLLGLAMLTRTRATTCWLYLMPQMVAVVVCLIAGCAGRNPLTQSTVTFIPPDSVTVTNMHVIQQRIEMYVRENGTSPSSLDQLPVIPNKVSSTADGWGRQIGLSISGDTVTLTSLGADGKPGGEGDNRDFIATMRVVDETVVWVTPPRLH